MRQKTALAVVALAILGAAFYWYDLRPRQIRKDCIQTYRQIVLRIAEQIKDSGDDLGIDELERQDAAIFKHIAFTLSEKKKKEKFYRKLRVMERKRDEPSSK